MSGTSILIVAGEASGDLHGSHLAMELKNLRPDAILKGIGGSKMEQAGVELLYSIRDFAFLGFSEVIRHLPFIRRVFKRMERLFKEDKPDLVILIDYPGFNLRLAKMAKRYRIPVFYYISPQVWAWHSRRARTIARRADRLAVILPFEVEFYRRRTGLQPDFVGHPLLEIVHSELDAEQFCHRWHLDAERPILGLLPGSRTQEIGRLLPVMVRAGRLLKCKVPDLQIAIGTIPSIQRSFYEKILRQHGVDVVLVEDQTYELMNHSQLLVVASGTATLETGILGKPMVILYRMSFLSWLIALLLVRVRHIGLVNLVAGERVVPELIQYQVNPRRVAREVYRLLKDKKGRDRMAGRLLSIRKKLGHEGASRRTAELALDLIAPQR